MCQHCVANNVSACVAHWLSEQNHVLILLPWDRALMDGVVPKFTTLALRERDNHGYQLPRRRATICTCFNSSFAFLFLQLILFIIEFISFFFFLFLPYINFNHSQSERRM